MDLITRLGYIHVGNVCRFEYLYWLPIGFDP